jgi:Fe-Mn family superoxide dismutase
MQWTPSSRISRRGQGRRPSGRLGEGIVRTFGFLSAFREEFTDLAARLFGSGYLWLTYDLALGRVALEPMKDADNPLLVERVPLLTMDVWEHADYLDYQNARNRFAEALVTHLANWRFANANLEKAACAGEPACLDEPRSTYVEPALRSRATNPWGS